jgi:ParB family chromosome partitioning protein
LRICQSGAQLFAEGRRTLAQLFIMNNVQYCMGRRDRQRVPGVSSTQTTRRRCIHDFGFAHDARQRHAAREAFRHGHQVRFIGVMIHRKQLARTGKPALYFIGDHHDAMLVANTADGSHKFRRCHHEAPFALDGFEDNRRNLGWIDIGFKQTLNRF